MQQGFAQNNVNFAHQGSVPSGGSVPIGGTAQNFDVQNVQATATNAAAGAKQHLEEDTFLKSLLEMQHITPETVAGGAAIFGSFFALSKYLDNKKLTGNWEDTLLGRLEDRGNRLNDKITNSPLNKVLQPIGKAYSGAKKFILDKVLFLNTPLRSLHPMTLAQADGAKGHLIPQTVEVIRKFIEKSPDEYKRFMPNCRSKTEALELLDKISANPDHKGYLRRLIKNLRAVTSDTRYTPDKFFKEHAPWLTETRTPSQMANKLEAALGTRGRTTLGRLLPKAFMEARHVFMGNKNIAGIISLFMAAAIKKTIEAPKGEKVATFMDSMASEITFFALMPAAFSVISTIGGLKYLGVGKTPFSQMLNVHRGRKAFRKLKNDVKSKSGSLTKYLADGKAAESIFKVDVKWWKQPFKWFGQALSFGLEHINSYTFEHLGGVGNRVSSYLYKAKDILKNVGGFGRAILAFALVMPVFTKVITKGAHAIFGRPTKSSLDEEEAVKPEEEPKAVESLEQRLMKHPEVITYINNNPAVFAEIERNPALLVRMLDEADARAAANPTVVPNSPQPASSATVPNTPQPYQQPQHYQQPQVMNPAVAPSTPQPYQQPQAVYNPQTNTAIENVRQETAANAEAMQSMPDITKTKMQEAAPVAEIKQPKPSPVVKNEEPEEPEEPVRTYIPSSAPVPSKEPVRTYVPSSEPAPHIANRAENIDVNSLDPSVQKILMGAQRAEDNASRFMNG